jgi:hypothetical protein
MNPAIPQKQLLDTLTPVEAICYVDVERYNPLNAQDYIFSANADTSETQFFNYVVLAYSYLTKDARGYTHLELRPTLKYILDNSVTYIKPLHQKGIKVLIEVRSGNFTDEQDGIGAGLGTMDMASINEFTKELKLLVDQYGIDGFDFNDVGGGRKSYPPASRDLKQFQSNQPLYSESLFQDANGDPITDPEKIEDILWIEGGSNFSNLIQKTNEDLKETYSMTYKNGSLETSETQAVERVIMVRDRNHGRHLLSSLRMAYMPDAYTGADPKVIGNLRYIINDIPYDASIYLHATLWDEGQKKDVGADADDRYAPFAVDLLDQKSRADAELSARAILLKNLAGSTTDTSNRNRYGALYFTNLGPVSEFSDPVTYMTYFSRTLFGRNVKLSETPGAGDYKKTW